jgi:hypothetical protein
MSVFEGKADIDVPQIFQQFEFTAGSAPTIGVQENGTDKGKAGAFCSL